MLYTGWTGWWLHSTVHTHFITFWGNVFLPIQIAKSTTYAAVRDTTTERRWQNIARIERRKLLTSRAHVCSCEMIYWQRVVHVDNVTWVRLHRKLSFVLPVARFYLMHTHKHTRTPHEQCHMASKHSKHLHNGHESCLRHTPEQINKYVTDKNVCEVCRYTCACGMRNKIKWLPLSSPSSPPLETH